MTDPTGNAEHDVARLRLTLDNGELLEVDGSAVDDGELPLVVLRLAPWRAFDLAQVLATYTRMVELMSESAEVSGTEASLSRGLLDAVAVARPPREPAPTAVGLGKVTSGRRAQAMAELQRFRPDLDHLTLIAVVDAAAMWTDADEDYLVTSLLRAVAGDQAAGAAYLALTGIGTRPGSDS